ncbi:MAG: proteasome assembly chaperone family protein [Candidatus Woesearchaeota archaeon]
MELVLNKKPQNSTILEGFPGVGLVGTITTEFLTKHLECEEIGYALVDNVSPMVAIHGEELVKPITIYHNKKYNLVIIHSILPGSKAEWEIAKTIIDLSKKVKSKRIISIEGVPNLTESSKHVYYYAHKKTTGKSLEKAKIKPLKEGMIVGVTAALMSKCKDDFISLFAESQTKMPDSRASAKIIQSLDQFLGFGLDYKPLLKQAEQFEKKLKSMVQQGKEATAHQKAQEVNYVG